MCFLVGRPIFFRQKRAGRNGEIFELVKFRSMETRIVDMARTDEERLVPFGKLLRSSSLDEIPELFHVLKGQMSLVGPRPLLPEYLPRYTPRQLKRHEVRPGLTGLAQINGRNLLSWEQRLELDVLYVENRSLPLYIRILVRSVWVVLKQKGVNASDGKGMAEFRGSR